MLKTLGNKQATALAPTNDAEHSYILIYSIQIVVVIQYIEKYKFITSQLIDRNISKTKTCTTTCSADRR